MPANTLQRQLAAVHSVLGNGRTTTEIDLLLTTILEMLQDEQLSLASIVERCNEAWPAVELEEARIQLALESGSAAGLLAEVPSLDESESAWTVTGLAIPDLRQAEAWAQTVIDETTSEIAALATTQGMRVDEQKAALWCDIIWAAVSDGMKAAESAFYGAISQRADRTLAPDGFDSDAAYETVANRCRDHNDYTFLRALVDSAMDPSDPFGNTLVSHVCTGHVLLAFLARRDHLEARSAIGSLRDRRAIIETPWLLAAPATRQTREAFERTIRSAVRAGIEVVIPEHSLDEVRGVLSRVADDASSFETDLARGETIDALLPLRGETDSIIPTWLEWARETGVIGFSAFERHVLEFLQRSTELGVSIRPHHNDDAGDLANVGNLAAHLRQAIADADSGRGEEAIERDAHTLTMAWRTRRKRNYLQGAMPASWVITTDRRMNDAYATFDPRDRSRIAITPAQWAGLLAACADPIDSAQLASSAVSLMTREIGIRVSTQWSPRVIMELAKALQPDSGITALDVRLAKGELETLLADSSGNPFVDPARTGATMATTIVARRTARTMGAQRERDASYRQVVEASRRTAQVSSTRASQVGEELAQVRRELEAEKAEREKEAVLSRRKNIATIITLAGLFAVVLLLVQTDFAKIAVGTLLATLWFAFRATEWTQRPASNLRTLYVSGLFELVAVIWEVLAS